MNNNLFVNGSSTINDTLYVNTISNTNFETNILQ